ncbi:MAG: HD domain-containing protein [Steroidobacterales bacterium]
MDTPSIRRSDYDITNSVRVSSAPAVLRAVEQLLVSVWPQFVRAPLERAFADFDALFAGRMPGYAGVDTVYHDRQHTLDVTLAMARLTVGYERQAESLWQLGSERAVAGIILALFHDVGYLRRSTDRGQSNGAEFTRNHVSRGVEFLREYLPCIGLAPWAPVAAQILHFTGYERPFSDIDTDDARDLKLGHLLGTADMIAQMSDRCYLEKCRDRLYPEFVLGGVALGEGHAIRYASGLDLLRQTPQFVAETRSKRLDRQFDRAYRYLEPLFDGRNPYLEMIDRNMQYLEQVLRSESWRLLRRNPPLHAADPNTLTRVRGLMLGYFKKAWLRD